MTDAQTEIAEQQAADANAVVYAKEKWFIRLEELQRDAERDMPQILDIEEESFKHPWNEAEFRQYLQRRETICYVAKCGPGLAGYVIVQLRPRFVRVLNIAVSGDVAGRGVGAKLLAHIARHCDDSRPRVVVEISESGLAAQMFFRACGFCYTRTLPDYFCDGQAAYRMVWQMEKTAS